MFFGGSKIPKDAWADGTEIHGFATACLGGIPYTHHPLNHPTTHNCGSHTSLPTPSFM